MPCLSLRLVVGETRRALLHYEPTRAARRIRQNRVGVGDAAVADPLLAAVDLVADDLAVLHHAIRRGLQRPQIAARVRLGGAVGEQHAFLGDARQPELLLLRRGADGDRVAAQEGGEHRGGNAQVDARHLLADAVHVEGAAAESAVLLGNKQKLNAQLVRAAHVFARSRAGIRRARPARSVLRPAIASWRNPCSDFQTQLQSLFGDHHRVPRLSSSALALTNSCRSAPGRNSRMSSTIPTSATWKIGALGFLLMATMKGCP